jgi:phosphate transport system substrate-binding protein
MLSPFVTAACLALAALFVAQSSPAAPIRLAGSDLFDGALRQELETYVKSTDISLSFDLRGSRLGMEAMRTKKADLALVVFAADEAKPGPEYSTAVIGYLTSVLVVPQDITLTQINYDQLAGIFGASEQNNYKRWIEIGALGDWAPRSISAMALGRETGLATDIFRFNVLQMRDLKPTVTVLPAADKVYERLRGEEGGIAIMATPPPANTGLKVLLVAKRATGVAYGPTSENLHTGDYPISLPVHLVFRKGEAGKLGLLIRHLLSDTAQPAMARVGLVPLPVQARNQLVFDLETM